METRDRLVNSQRKDKTINKLKATWEERLNGRLFDIADSSEFLNITTHIDGTKKFFLCNSTKISSQQIEKGYRLKTKAKAKVITSDANNTHPHASSNSSFYSDNNNSSVVASSSDSTATNDAKHTSSNSNSNSNSNIFKHLLTPHSTADLLQASFIQPTLKGNSFGPGDAHKRAMDNYYHVVDSLPPNELKVGECPNPLLYYKEAAPPPLKQSTTKSNNNTRGLLCGISGKPIPYPHVLNYRSVEEKNSFFLKPLKTLSKGAALDEKKRELHTKSTLMRKMFTNPEEVDRDYDDDEGGDSDSNR